jgi:hypothetical protein
MALYKKYPSDTLPLGLAYRVLGTACPWWDGQPDLIETREAVPGLTEAPEFFPNGVPTKPHDNCGADWVECTDAEARTAVVDSMVADYKAKVEAELATVEDVRAIDVSAVAVAIAEKEVGVKPVGKVVADG